MIKFANVVCMVTALVATLVPSTASAVLQSVNDPVHGPGSITTDTDTGLEWLDLTNSYDQTFLYVASQFGPGGAYEGFRHARSVEVKLYFQHAGISVDTGWSAANYAPCLTFQGLAGHTEASPTFWQSVGFIVDIPGPGFRNLALVNTNSAARPPEGVADSGGPLDTEDDHQPNIGHWLVRPGHPVGVEPKTWTGVRNLYR
jgi:hypothetical protein